MFVKVCGIRTRGQIDWAVELGYSAVGVVLHPPSPRYCAPEAAASLAAYARGRIASVAVGVSFEEVSEVYDGFDFAQIYEYRCMERLILAGVQLPERSDYAYFLYDASRGSGEFDQLPEWLFSIRERLIVSGGLNPYNVGPVIRKFMPFGVDVSSGVETGPGLKDYSLMKKFMEEVAHAS
jgi:phosphoribosylanthranilate isomerase